MVDVERFDRFVNAVQTLGVKAVIVGDGAQLQPVEAGPAFRLVTTRLGKTELNTVLRQKEDWQRDATVLFGRQETKEAIQKYMDSGYVHIIEEGPSQRRDKDFDKREKTKEAVVQAWHTAFKENKEHSTLILAYSNKDVNDLNRSARFLLKESGHIAKNELTYTIQKEVEDDFGSKHALQEEKGFSKGDRIVFTRNNYGLGVKNGTMGIITDLDQNKVHVKLDEGKEISFAPKLNPHFDQGWAVTIHKSQGTTVDHTFVLASYPMNQNLTYVAMTRHREDVHVFGSSLDFWQAEKLPEVLSKSGEKLSAADYLDADSLNKLMQKEDRLLSKIFNRISNELEAMGVVTKQAFWNVADHFLGIKREKEIRVPSLQEGIREEVRAGELLQQKQSSPALEAVYEEMKHPAFNNAMIIKQAFEKGLKARGEEQAIAYWNTRKEDFLQPYNQNLAKVEKELISPLLNRYTNEWKDQAHTFAQQDPAHVLTVLTKVKTREAARYERIAAEEKARQEKMIADEKAAQERQAHRDYIKDTYLRFNSLYDMVKDTRTIPEAFKENLKKFSKTLAQDHEFMSHLKWKDEDEVEKIKQVAQSKNIEDHFRSLDRGRGGYSL